MSDTPASGHRAPDIPASDIVPGFDLTPLADLIERQAKELADLREAAAFWQVRAHQAEEQLKQLSAGETPPETSPEATGASPANDRGTGRIWAWVKRAWRT
jgi:hypothetical protein